MSSTTTLTAVIPQALGQALECDLGLMQATNGAFSMAFAGGGLATLGVGDDRGGALEQVAALQPPRLHERCRGAANLAHRQLRIFFPATLVACERGTDA